MKKIISLSVIFPLMVTVFTVTVCGCAKCDKFDENGRGFYLEYNANYTIESMVFPESDHIHFKDFYLGSFEKPNTPQGFVGNIFNTPYESLIKERFFFTIFHQYDDIKRNAALTFVSGHNYNLEVAFEDTLGAAMEHLDDDTFELGYEVTVKRLNDDSETKQESKDRINELGFIQVTPEVLQIRANFFAYDWSYTNAPIPIRNFYDPIAVFMYSQEYEGSVFAVNIENDSKRKLRTNYDRYNNLYVFEIIEPGTYALVSDDNFEIPATSTITTATTAATTAAITTLEITTIPATATTEITTTDSIISTTSPPETTAAESLLNSGGNPHTGVVIGMIPMIIAGVIAAVNRRKVE